MSTSQFLGEKALAIHLGVLRYSVCLYKIQNIPRNKTKMSFHRAKIKETIHYRKKVMLNVLSENDKGYKDSKLKRPKEFSWVHENSSSKNIYYLK